MTVWRRLWDLLGYAVRGRGYEPVYVVAEALPDAVQEELDDRNLAIVEIYAPPRRADGFVVVVAKPEPAGEEQHMDLGPVAAFPPMRIGRAEQTPNASM
jgi:hypothetical protein